MPSGWMWLDLLLRSIRRTQSTFAVIHTFSLFQLESKSYKTKQCWQYKLPHRIDFGNFFKYKNLQF